MQILEGSDTRIRFKINEIEDNITSVLDYDDFTDYRLEIKFDDDSLLEIKGTVDDTTTPITVYFDIFSEYTENKQGTFTADIWGTKDEKKVRFNPTTIKGKVLNSVKIPDGVQDNNSGTDSDNNLGA